MATFESFEEMDVWRKARELTRKIYAISNEGRFSRDFALRNQICRASISILSNIAEGFERSGTSEFAQFLAIAKGSAGEVRAQLYVALDQHYISREQFRDLTSLVIEISRMLSGLMKYLRSSNIKGTKYRDSTTSRARPGGAKSQT